MSIEKKILSIFRVIEAMPETGGVGTSFAQRIAALNSILTDDDRKVMADVVKSMLILTAGNQKTLRDPSLYDPDNLRDNFNMLMNTKMYRTVTMLKLPIEVMSKPTQADYVMAKKLIPFIGSASVDKGDIDASVGKLTGLDRRFKSEGYDTVYRGLNKLKPNTIAYLMNEPTWDMKRGVSTSYYEGSAAVFAKIEGSYGSTGGPAVIFEISNISKRGFHADTLSRYPIEKEVILSGEIKVSDEWELQAFGRIMPDPDSGEAPGRIKINFNSKTMINTFNWLVPRGKGKENIKIEKFPNDEAFLSFCEEAVLNQSGLLIVNGQDWEYEMDPKSILLKIKATLP